MLTCTWRLHVSEGPSCVQRQPEASTHGTRNPEAGKLPAVQLTGQEAVSPAQGNTLDGAAIVLPIWREPSPDAALAIAALSATPAVPSAPFFDSVQSASSSSDSTPEVALAAVPEPLDVPASAPPME